jgi:23S rRNA (cytidine1920-2'-O)/16S rRNA (cytidine1409-2'-O)-methyltransferase
LSRTDRQRLDVWLFEQEKFPSREAARRAVMAGWVFVNGRVADKPGLSIRALDEIDVRGSAPPYVSRGGLKLNHALEQFRVPCAGRIALDVGASTGGFTDCLLQHGCTRVFAVDVGYGQLAWSIRQDERVEVMERTNFRHVDAARFAPKPDLVVMDVSFISTVLLFPKIAEVAAPGADVLSLIKPQFEAGRDSVGKGGIVRDPEVHFRVLLDMLEYVRQAGWSVLGLDVSPVTGGDGNIEFLGWWRLSGEVDRGFDDLSVRSLVQRAWKEHRFQNVLEN